VLVVERGFGVHDALVQVAKLLSVSGWVELPSCRCLSVSEISI
jgi:hypothetical protein